jgi:signal transduction histidine kinase
MRDANGKLARFIVVVTDVTERKQMELERARLVQELRRAVQARDDFLAIAAHELMTPITPLRLQAARLLRDVRRGSPIGDLERRLDTIAIASERLESLTDKLLDVSRISVGRLALELEDVDLVDLLEETVGKQVEEVQRSGSTVDIVAHGPIVGRWDRVRLGQLATNLLVNALKYGAGKPITIGARQDASTVWLSVRDRGIGIPAEDQTRIFERFERLTPVRHHGGFGLGLWIVREIARAHGGTVTVSSRLGEGAEFTVALPLLPLHATCTDSVTTKSDHVAREERKS